MVVVELKRVPDSPDDRCAQFKRCLLDRTKKGPPEHREPGEAEQIPVGDLSSIEVYLPRTGIELEDAKQRVAEAAAACDEDWHELYAFPSTP